MKKLRMIPALLCMILAVSMILGACTPASEAAKTAQKKEEKEGGGLDKDDKKDKKDDVKEADPGGKDKEQKEFDLFEEMSNWEYTFSSGAGGWQTNMTVMPDGTFKGLYNDSDMGDTGDGYPDGTLYECSFMGKFSEPRKVDKYTYMLEIADIKYENEPGKEEIKDNMHLIYTKPYGLEEVVDKSEDLFVYLPGRDTKDMTEDFWSWIGYLWYGAYLGSDMDYVDDIPEDLTFCALYNTKGLAFYSYPVTENNSVYLSNRAKLPGLEAVREDMNDDGTYLYEDMDENGMVHVYNGLFGVDKLNLYEDSEKLVRACLDRMGIEDVSDINFMDADNSQMYYDKISVNGKKSFYVTFTSGQNEDAKDCIGRFIQYDGSYEKENRAYAYVIASPSDLNMSDSPYSGELLNFYLGSLTFTGRKENISSAGGKCDLKERIYAEVTTSTDQNVLRAEKVYWVTAQDTDLIKKYNLDPDEFYDDYQIAGFDGNYTNYKLSKNCIFYVQYPEDKFHKLVTANSYGEYIKKHAGNNSRLMNFILDNDGNVVMVYEPYTP